MMNTLSLLCEGDTVVSHLSQTPTFKSQTPGFSFPIRFHDLSQTPT